MPDLRPAQKEAVGRIYFSPTLLLADVGAGKTASALRALRTRSLIIPGGMQRTLVIGTKRICASVWPDEVKKWTPELHYNSAAGPDAQRRQQTLENPFNDMVGLNFQNIPWLVKTYGENLPRLFPWLIIDESSLLENPASKSFQRIKPLLPLFQWRLPMTGTPRANHLYDLWGSVYLADCGKALGEYRESFLQRWFMPVKLSNGQMLYLPKPNAEQEIYERLAGVVHRMPFHHPGAVELDMRIPLNDSVAAVLGDIEDQLDDHHTEVIVNGATFIKNGKRSYVKQLQLSSGFVYKDDGTVWNVHTDKLDALAEIVAEAKGEPMMVVFQFDHERDAILARFPLATLLTDNIILDAWNAGEIEMLLVHPRSCGHGLNAQDSGCSLQVWFTPTPDAELYTQTIGRINRPGNPNAVRVIRLIMDGTRDMDAYLTVAARQRGERGTLDMFED